MYLVYEKNYLNYGDVDCVEEDDMKLYSKKENATSEMERRKQMYIDDDENDFTFMEDESLENTFVFADELNKINGNRCGEFHICLVELNIEG